MEHSNSIPDHGERRGLWARSAAAVAATALIVAFLTACNTTKGVGKDVEGLGEGIQDAAEAVQD